MGVYIVLTLEINLHTSSREVRQSITNDVGFVERHDLHLLTQLLRNFDVRIRSIDCFTAPCTSLSAGICLSLGRKGPQ